MKILHGVRSGGVVLASVALVVTLPGTANASSTVKLSHSGSTRAEASFAAAGEVFTLWDRAADGKSVQVTYTSVVKSSWLINSKGKGEKTTRNLELPEGSRVTYSVSYGNASNGSIPNPIAWTQTKVDEA
ncbi:hypothetical protein [Aeromicrobium sp.]|uniref:hypothetical protein n=1 Tax=Aeromicrobium sp. TaxID=1871063 RepID=UPI0028A9C079|nr:hypothetical protein [Aeromicrobium sp.]